MTDRDVVIDASAMVDLILGAPTADAITGHIAGSSLHAPAHLDLEVVSALARIHRAGARSADMVGEDIAFLESAPIKRHPIAPHLAGAWARRNNVRLADAVYLELAAELDTLVVTTDAPLARSAPELAYCIDTSEES